MIEAQDDERSVAGHSTTMRAVRLHEPGGALVLDEVAIPRLQPGEALVRVHAAAITRDELEWPVDRLPAIPSYEVSGVVADVAADVTSVAVGDEVYALTPFDRDGAAADYVAVPAGILAPKPSSLNHVESAAIPLAALSARQGLVDHGALTSGRRVLILGATGGVGHFATQLARQRGAYVIGTASAESVRRARDLGADEAYDRSARLEETLAPVDLVFDTVGGDALARSSVVVASGGRIVSVAEEQPARPDVTATYFVVEPSRGQLVELARLVDTGALHAAVDSVFSLVDASAAFERVQAKGKHGKVVLEIR